MDWSGLAITLMGVALLVLAVWIWRGRSAAARSWIRFPIVGDLASLTAFPALGLLCFGGGLSLLGVPDGVSMPLFIAGFVPFVWGFPVLCVARFYWPAAKLWGPSWYTTLSKSQIERTESSGSDVLEVGAQKQPTWAGRNLDYWYGAETTPGIDPNHRNGHLWLAEHGVFFDPKNRHQSGVTAARAQWDKIHTFSRSGRTITVTITKNRAEETHTFRMPLLRARRAEKQTIKRMQEYAESAL